MWLPASYSTGFAPRDDAPLYPQLWKGCVGAWNMGLGPTGNTLRDWSGFGNHGTLTNGPTWVASQGKYAISFDGTNDYVQTSGTEIVPSGSASKTVSLWFQSNTTISTRQWLFYAGTETSNGRFCLEIESSKLNFNYFSGALVYTTVLSSNVLYHAAVTYYQGATEASLYLNGVSQVLSSGVAMNTGQSAVRIGSFVTGALYLNGLIDDVRVYNRALSPYEIRLLASRRGIAYEMQDRRLARQIPATTSGYSVFKSSIIRASA